jgi:methionyl-tRNA formyltransferase
MRILLCLNRDLMSNLALNLLWPALQGHVFDLVLSHGVARQAPRAPEIEAWQRIEHAIVEEGLFPLLDARRPAGEFQSFEQRASNSESGAPLSFVNLNRDHGLDYIRRFAPELILSIRFGQIFRAPLIELPRLGILNLHSGTLPEYRGVVATFWAMLEDAEIGCTLHYVTDGTIDTGPIVGTRKSAPDRSRSLLWNVASLYRGGAEMVGDAVGRLSRGEPIAAEARDEAKGRYLSYPNQKEVAQFHARGLKLYSPHDYAAILAGYGLLKSEIAGILSKLP